MQKRRLALKKKKGYIFLIILMSLMSQIGIAQGAFPNVRVNDVTTGNQTIDGSNLISVLEGSVYVVWQDERVIDTINVYFSKSTDRGTTFAPGIPVSNIPDSVAQLFPAIDVDNSGVVYVAWTVLSYDMVNAYGIWLAKSLNGGISFEPAVQISDFGVFPSLSVYGGNVYVLFADHSNYPMADYYFARSTNGGASFEPAYQINDVNCTVPVEKFEELASLCTDEAGDIYAAWNDGRRLGGNSDIYFAKSTNAGVSFGANVPVNDITVQAGDSIQYKPAITVGAENKVYVSFADLRLGSNDWTNNRAYLSVSDNGGSSFSPEVLLAEHNDACHSFDLMALPNDKLSAVMMANFTPEGWGIWLLESNDGGANFSLPVPLSDTFNIDANSPNLFLAPNGNAYAVWQDPRLGESDVYFSKNILTTPENVAITLQTDSTFALTWDMVAGASGYKVYSSLDPYGVFSEDSTGTFTESRKWEKLFDGNKYFYYIIATDATKGLEKYFE